MFGRRTTKDDAAAQSAEAEAKAGGKGRPTPSRKEAEAARKKRMTPPRNRKEASALQRQRMKDKRKQQRAALDSGDERYLPPRDQGPVKSYVRNYVDSRYTIGQFMLPGFFVIFALFYVNQAWAARLSSSAFLSVLLLVILDSIRIRRGVKAGITERFGADEARGSTMYALMRAWQMRRLRLPKPQVKPGDRI
ncbi:MAG: DUF3043 domain-containing protein [Nocardioidaceae bacterium]